MLKLTHFRLCPLSRSIRLALSERDLAFDLAEERAWEWRAGFLALNPAGELPVLEIEHGVSLCGVYSISEYLAEGETDLPAPDQRRRIALFPGSREDRAEVRRLVDWFHRKLDRETSRDLLAEKVHPQVTRLMSPGARMGQTPSPQVLRAARANLRHHLTYVSYLADHRRWLAGDEMSFADLAAAAHLSVADFLGEIAWDEAPGAKAWYQRIKSRPSFQPLLADRLPGFTPPPHYADLDF
jgi:glutathione S-transferase